LNYYVGKLSFMPEKRASPRLNIRHVNPAVSKGAGVRAHMSEDVREGRIRMAVHGRLVDIIELKALIDARSNNKKRLRL
jgi:hypothetical protein